MCVPFRPADAKAADSFDDQDIYPANSAPLPDAAGPPLLDDTDSHLLDNFFSNPDGFDGGVAYVQPGSADGGGASSGLDWTFAAPPSFHGASTALAGGLPLHARGDPGHGGPSQTLLEQSASDEVLGAASTLFSTFQTVQPQLFSAANLHSEPLGNLRGLHTPNYLSAERAATALFPASISITRDDPLLAEPAHSFPPGLRAFHGSIHLAPEGTGDPHLGSQRPGLRRPYRFGSDGNFNTNGYALPPRQETEEEVTSRLMEDMRAMGKTSTARAETASLTLADFAAVSPPHRSGRTRLSGDESTSSERHSSPGPRKKRKCRSTISEAVAPTTAGSDLTATTSPHRSDLAPNSAKAYRPSQSNPPTKRKKSPVAGHRSHRENLSEEQKRNNHILSEQKRRNLIKQGFEDLHILVPELRSGGFSKSNVLMEAATFLEGLVRGNNALRARLAELEKG